MIEDGCLEGVDEIYGLHNRPIKLQKDAIILVKEGTIYA